MTHLSRHSCSSALAVALVVTSLAACGDDDATSGTTAPPAATTGTEATDTETASTATTATTTTAPGVPLRNAAPTDM